MGLYLLFIQKAVTYTTIYTWVLYVFAAGILLLAWCLLRKRNYGILRR